MTKIIGRENSIFNTFIAEIRDSGIQKDSMRFRRNMERIGEVMAYEVSKDMHFKEKDVVSPLGISHISLLDEQPVIACILRAGLPLQQGVLNYFDRAGNAFISAYRKPHKDGSFEIQVEYLSSPQLNDKTVILCDPMIATGASVVLTYKALMARGTPKHTHIITAIASSQGIEYVKRNLPANITVWAGAVDDELTVQSYIVPGLGDAGDLAFGEKV